MAEVTAVPAASVLLVRDGTPSPEASPYEVLMLHRHEQASFVPGVWVFPGGAVDDLDREVARERFGGTHLAAMRTAAARELFEETGVWLGGPLENAEQKRRRLLAGNLGIRALLEECPVDIDALVWTSHWITPVGIPKRFDTYFFLAAAPPDSQVTLLNEEAVDARWVTPEEALRELKMVFPTIRNLEAVRGFTNASELIASRRGQEIPVIQPIIVDGKIRLP